MANTEMLSLYIKKLGHPLKEIRERSLQLLITKLKLGWEFEDELSGTRGLLEGLLAWFNAHQPSLQREALALLLHTIKTKAGTYIVKEFGIENILLTLKKIKSNITEDVLPLYEDVVETLRFMNTVESDVDLVPRLVLPDVTSSESEHSSSSGYYNLGPNFQSSKVSSISVDSDPIRCKNTNPKEVVRVLLFPWVELCRSDKKTLLLAEDALRLLKSTRRCCRFIGDVFLRDFPAEVFLNRPEIIKNLVAISEGSNGGQPSEAMVVLLHITQALRRRLLQLSCIDLLHHGNELREDSSKDLDEGLNVELAELAGEHLQTPLEDDGLALVKQLPAPLFAVDTLLSVLATITRSVVMIDPVEKTEVLGLRELNICIHLVETLIGLLLDCIDESFWSVDHSVKTYRDIAHKSCMVMRALGDLLGKYRKSFFNDPERSHHRIAWLRLVSCAEKLLYWARDSAMPPTTLVAMLQIAQLDPAIELFYPELCARIETVLQNSRLTVNQEYKTKYRELKKIFASMEEAIKLTKNKKLHSSKNVLPCIEKSLPILTIFESESFLSEIADILLRKTKNMDLDENEWTLARNIAVNLMAHNIDWVQINFYRLLEGMVKSILVSNDDYQKYNDKSLTLLCDVGILTEICCHGLSSKLKEVEESASDIMMYLLRGRLVLSESCWWRLLASLLPILPLLHVYAAHETELGKAICKSLDCEIAECMGVSTAEVVMGLTRLLFVRCVAVQLDAAHGLCRLLDDETYLPPRDTLRADVLLSALRRAKAQEFNIDYTSSPSKCPQTAGLTQILDVLKQDLVFDEHEDFIPRRTMHPTLEPSLRRSTLQQLAVILRQQELHDTFLNCDGLRVIVATLRMSLMVDDYLAFPECAISCVSVLNSVCFTSRHNLAKIPDLPLLLIRVILVFPANDSLVLMAAQVLALVAWAGFALQELDLARHKVPALPLCVTQRTTLPFSVNSYWNTSPNAEHSYVEWLLAEEEWRAAIRAHWWCAQTERTRLLSAAPPPAPAALSVTARDLLALKSACPLYSCTAALQALQNATSHRHVTDALNMLESYVYLIPSSNVNKKDLSALPWQHMRRFLSSPPASSRDTALLLSLLHFVRTYIDHIPNVDGTMSWIWPSFVGTDASIISLLSRNEFYPQQTVQETIEVTQLHIQIVKVLLGCVMMLEQRDDYDTRKLESLLKILLACLNEIDLKNFHMLGYLNELMRCIRYVLNSRHCKLSEETLIQCLRLLTKTLSSCTSGGCKGQACRIDALLSLLALLRQIHIDRLPVQRWSESFSAEVVGVLVNCVRGSRATLRTAALHVIAALAYYAQMLPHLLQAIQESSLSQFAVRIFRKRDEANAVRAASLSVLVAIASRASSKSDTLESDVLEQLNENNFLEHCLEILVGFCNAKEFKQTFEPNVSLSVLERRSEFEVRAQKSADVRVLASNSSKRRPPPTSEFITSLADALHNVSAFPNCPVQEWNESGLYRLLFRCASWSCDSVQNTYEVQSSTRRALLAVMSHKCVLASLAATKDCLYNLLITLTAFTEDEISEECLCARAQGMFLLGSLLESRAAADSVWRMLKDTSAKEFFHLILQCLENGQIELQDAALYCLTQLAQSQKKQADKTNDETYFQFYDNMKSPFWEGNNNMYGGGDSARSDCQPEYMAEEICKALINLYQKLSCDTNNYHLCQDDRWQRLCSCLSSVLSVSGRTRLYSAHRQLPRLLISTMQDVRDHLSVRGKPADVIRQANSNPVLGTLYWLLTLIDCVMVDCAVAKESFVEEGLPACLCRLWPWCMMTERLKHAVLHLLYTFTNDCPKAWGGMSQCVGGRSLSAEASALCAREAAAARPRALLLLALHVLRRAMPHHHCRAILLKSEVLSTLYGVCMRSRVRGPGSWVGPWARTWCSAARYAEGAAALLALRVRGAPLTALPSRARADLLPALAHAAHHHRLSFLQSPDLLELLSGTLLAGDVAEVVSAARAVWALAANHHKAKLVLRSAGVSSAVHTALLRLQHCKDESSQRALQLLTYTNTVLQTT